jgi:hypothetical protein
LLLFGFSNAAKAADVNPLRPIDASSPRATLQGFVETLDKLYLHMADLLKSYAASDRLYLSPEERPRQIEILLHGLKAVQFLDTSETAGAKEIRTHGPTPNASVPRAPHGDRRVLHLIKMWLECPVEETDQRGRTTRTGSPAA